MQGKNFSEGSSSYIRWDCILSVKLKDGGTCSGSYSVLKKELKAQIEIKLKGDLGSLSYKVKLYTINKK